jgi:hypothetical protein
MRTSRQFPKVFPAKTFRTIRHHIGDRLHSITTNKAAVKPLLRHHGPQPEWEYYNETSGDHSERAQAGNRDSAVR